MSRTSKSSKQVFLGFDGIPDTPLKVGRQRIILDNARFVGNVGFRQLEQTFDAARIENIDADRILDSTISGQTAGKYENS